MSLPLQEEPWRFTTISLEQGEKVRLPGELSGLGLWAWNLSSGEVSWNLEQYRLFDLEPAEFAGTIEAWLELVHPQDIERFQKRVQQAFIDGLPYEDEFRVCPRKGGGRWLMGRGVFERDSTGRIVRMVGINMNITERKEAERALLEREATMRDVLERQRRFVADASHELRAPLTAIQGNLELLRRYPGLSARDRSEALDETENEAKRLGRLVSDLLALARADAGLLQKKELVSLETVLEEAAVELSVQAQDPLLELGTLEQGTLQPCRVQGDRDRLKQLVFILLDNALKYTPKGGRVCLELTRAPEGVRLEVRDSGIGISEQDLPHVFERFYRADQARVRSKDSGGTGLGLSIAQWIVQQHNGEIALESELGVGTTARVIFPMVDDESLNAD